MRGFHVLALENLGSGKGGCFVIIRGEFCTGEKCLRKENKWIDIPIDRYIYR